MQGKFRIVLIGCLVFILICIIFSLIGFTILGGWANTVTAHDFPLKQRWVYQASERVQAMVTGLQGEIIIRTASSIALLNPENGKLIWSDELPQTPLATPPVVSGNIVVTSYRAGTIAYNLKTGERLWIDKGDNFSSGDDFTAGSNDNIVVTIGKFVNVRDLRTGEVLWQIKEPVPDYGALAAVDNDYVYLILFDEIRGYNLASGKLIWSVKTPTAWSLRSMLFQDKFLYLEDGTKGGGVGAFNVKTQEMDWLQKGDFTTFSNPITKYGNYLFVPVTSGHPVMLDAQTGRVVWRATETPVTTYLSSLVVDNIVYVKSLFTKDLYALDLKDGSVIGYLDLGLIDTVAGKSSGPFLSGSSIIFADNDRIFAYTR